MHVCVVCCVLWVGQLADMVGSGQLAAWVKNGQLSQWVDTEALASFLDADNLRELGIDINELDTIAAQLGDAAVEELPGALEKGAEFLKSARKNKQV